MALITAIETKCFSIPLPFAMANPRHGTMTSFELITTVVRDADGAEGLGYTFTVGASGLAIVTLIDRYLMHRLVGLDAERIEQCWQHMWWALHYGGRGGPVSLAISAVDIALWDLKARRFKVPLWRLLGGNDQRVPVYVGGIDLNLPIDDLLKETEKNLVRGFRAIKMKVGRERLSEDVERVHAMRKHLGPECPLMVDANMGWTVDEALRAARALAPFDLYWIEEPTIPEDFAGHARIAREATTPIATGENLHSLYEFRQLIETGGVGFPEPDVTSCGGVTVFLKIAHLAEAWNLPVTSHGAHDITVHLLASVPNRSFLELHAFGLDRFITDPLMLEEGMAVAPDREGHGIQFNWAALGECRIQ
jgi:L-alanine-DL-glutamate epimerase-like enolase superfamily enzyme